MLKKYGVFVFLCIVILLIFVTPLSSADSPAGQTGSGELKYDSDSSSYSFYSISPGGHGVFFNNPGTTTITGLKIFGKMYGSNPGGQVHVRLWDKNFNNLYAYEITYKDFPQGEADWVTVPVPPLPVTGDFYAVVFTGSAPQSSPAGGVSIGYDMSTQSGHSHILLGGGNNNKQIQDINIGPNKDLSQSMIDWKIRVITGQAGASPSTSASASQKQDPLSSFYPLILVVLLVVVCIGAFGYHKYRQKSQMPRPSSTPGVPVNLSNQDHHDVFISYASVDKPVADAMCARIEAQNIRCWIAPRDVPPGKNFPEAIIDGIVGSKIMVVIFSSHANKSEHVIREVTTAMNKSLTIIPFRIEDVMPSKSMEYLIGTPHWLNALTPPLEDHLDTLITTIKKNLSNE